ncbi:MAG: alanine racemase [Desulfobacterales bacterium]|nr:alanine racemase [Desulfobacterales bacterium]
MTKKKAKKPYVKPSISRISFSDSLKFKGKSSASSSFDEIEGYPVKKLTEDFGSPLFVVSEAILRSRYRDLYEAFSKRYPKTTIAYSYKTNYLSGICAVLHQEGAWAEVVSGFEYEMARRLGITGEKIVFNGPYKKPADLARAFSEGATVNLDSYDEFNTAKQVAETLGRPSKVGIRVNMQLNYPAWDKFGFSLEDDRAYDICRQISQNKYLKLTGLHCHTGTFIIDPGIYRRLIENLISLAVKAEKIPGVAISYLDIGGGFASGNTLLSQLMPGQTTSPAPDHYAEAVCDVLNKRANELKNSPALFMEPGRSIVDESMFLLSKVVSVKETASGNRFAIIDAGVNLLPTAYYYKHDVISDREGPAEQVDVFGPLCMQIDVVRRGASLPAPKPGDIITIKNVGAYNFSQSMHFIFLKPAVILLGSGGIDVLRRAETYEDVKGLENIPKRLLKAKSGND